MKKKLINFCLNFHRETTVAYKEKKYIWKTTNVFVFGYFNSPRQEVNNSHNFENSKKLYLTNKGHFKYFKKLLYLWFVWQKNVKNKINWYFCNGAVFMHLKVFHVSERLSSLKKCTNFWIKLENNIIMIRENARKFYNLTNCGVCSIQEKKTVN